MARRGMSSSPGRCSPRPFGSAETAHVDGDPLNLCYAAHKDGSRAVGGQPGADRFPLVRSGRGQRAPRLPCRMSCR
ncbi:protein of unknown function [Blastococcus saxobsidens DD2]|uniref:Uncharacterized protein n=1 Tax=Blastococcus saxobsidens (strain DD2) TaxID=1146883 RepID=H6RRA1_BLASD|nr:protein of unknown function [Blastococcus saxobsidens DD2]